jgi:DNA-binding GntR family transcriptional regulator
VSPAHVLEPTYQRLKRALMEGTWANGAKLEAMRLADDFGVSMTPVRDSLNQLVGEGLVDLTPGDGFRVPVLTEQGLRDVLRVNAVLLETASDEAWRIPNVRDLDDWPDDYAGRMAAVFLVLATGSGNRCLAVLIDRISDRLHRVRIHEPDVLPDAAEILAEIEASLRGSRNERLRALRRYHRRCAEQVPQLVSRLSG